MSIEIKVVVHTKVDRKTISAMETLLKRPDGWLQKTEMPKMITEEFIHGAEIF